MLLTSKQVIKEEFKHLKLSEETDPQGISISGGGIRSASFGIGVLQALNAKNVKLKDQFGKLFEQFDYLSTVSGGGYAGTCLSWFRTRHTTGNFFPFGAKRSGNINLNNEIDESDTAKPTPESILSYIRLHGKYLTPGGCLDFISAFGTVLRGMLTSASFYFVFLTFTMVLLIGASEKAQSYSVNLPYLELSAIVDKFGELVTSAQNWISNNDTSNYKKLSDKDKYVIQFGLVLSILSALIFVLLTFIKAVILPIFTDRTDLGLLKDYWWRRHIQCINGLMLKLIIVGVIILTLPIVYRILQNGSTPYGIILGLAAAYFRFRSISGKSAFLSKFPAVIGNASMIIAAGIFIYVLLLYAYKFADYFWQTGAWMSVAYYAVALVIAGILININYVALGRMYRDRLMETFMPSNDAVNKNEWMPSNGADAFGLDELCKRQDNHIRPYHLINTNAVMVNDSDMRLKGRGGTSFLLSPIYVGSDPTKYTETENYMKKRGSVFNYTGLTAATAMAVSGAAANPNTGVGGEGKTRNFLISFLMTFFNIRLGFWGINPNASFFKRANILYPGIPALFGMGFKSSRPFLDLSDGGHFENLGMYELLRRRCKLIITSDAGADQNFNFADLGNAVERARVDFGITIRFNTSTNNNESYDLQHLLPGTAGDAEFMVKFQLAKRGFALATISYPEDKEQGKPAMEGLLLYIKSTLTKGLPADLYGYKAKNPSYPDQTTADQFFDEFQFEAYRELGYEITKSALADPTVKDSIEKVCDFEFEGNA